MKTRIFVLVFAMKGIDWSECNKSTTLNPCIMTPEESIDDIVPTETAGYKPPASKTLDELEQLDANDESLKKWKESLLKGKEISKFL